jgi:hypothetical protein
MFQSQLPPLTPNEIRLLCSNQSDFPSDLPPHSRLHGLIGGPSWTSSIQRCNQAKRPVQWFVSLIRVVLAVWTLFFVGTTLLLLLNGDILGVS